MSDHVAEELPLLLTGEADRETADAVLAHTAECEQCRAALRSVVLAFSAIVSARRLGMELDAPAAGHLSSAGDDPDQPLPDLSALFARIEAEAAAAQPAGGESRPDESARPADESAGSTGVAAAPSGVSAIRRGMRGRRARVVVAGLAAAACIALGAGVTYAVQHRSSASSTAQVVHLAAFDIGTTSGTAKIIGSDRIQLDASSLVPLGTTLFYQAWLTNAARTELLSLGPLGSAGEGTYTVPAHLIDSYSAIEVSVQPANGNPAFSGVSVLRGSYR